MTTKVDQRKLIERASAAVKKRYGGKISSERASVDLVFPTLWASTGSLALDRAIAGRLPGGVPMGPKRGKTVHVFGDPSLGKTLLLVMLLKGVQDLGGFGLVSDTEGGWDPHFATAIGLDLERVEIQRPATLEEMFDAGLEWVESVRKGDPDVPVLWGVDSITLIEAERSAGKAMSESGAWHFGGGKSEALGAGLSRVTNLCTRSQTSFVVLNQIRENVGVMFGPTKRPTGGWPARFAASVEIQLTSSRLGVEKDDRGRTVGRWVHAKIVKNRVAPPFRECDFYVDFRKGIRRWAGVAESLDDDGIIAVKREAKAGGKGRVVGTEFTVVRTGEVLPLKQFVGWCEQSKVLEQ